MRMDHSNIVTHIIEREEFHIDARYTNLKHIGRGAYGIVVEAEDTITKSKVSIKLIKNVFRDTLEAKRLLRELKLLCHFRNHANIVQIQNVMTYPPNRPDFEVLYLVTQLYECDLQRIINSKQVLTDGHIEYFIYQILKGLKYIHSAKVLHRDLKPANILVNADCSLAICDFGLSRSIAEPNSNLTEYVVTRWYRAPEILAGAADYDYNVDVWSVGCILGELLNTEALFRGSSFADQLRLIVRTLGRPSEEVLRTFPESAANAIREIPLSHPTDWSEKFPNKSPHLIDLLKRMLVIDPKKRISIDEALNHPAFKNVKEPESEKICHILFDSEFEKFYATDLDNKLLQSEFLADIMALRSFRNKIDQKLKRESEAQQQKVSETQKPVAPPQVMQPFNSRPAQANQGMEGIEDPFSSNNAIHDNETRYSRFPSTTHMPFPPRVDDEAMGEYTVPNGPVGVTMQPPFHAHQVVGHAIQGHIPSHYNGSMVAPDMSNVRLMGYGGHHSNREPSFPGISHAPMYGNGQYSLMPEERSISYPTMNGQHFSTHGMPPNPLQHSRPQAPVANEAHIQMSEDAAALLIPQSVAVQHGSERYDPIKAAIAPQTAIQQPSQQAVAPSADATRISKPNSQEGPILAGPINVPGTEFVRYNPLFAQYYTAAMITHFSRIKDIHKRQFSQSSTRPPYSVQWVPLLVNSDGEPVDMKDAIREIEKNGIKCMGTPSEDVAMLHSVFQRYVHTIFPSDSAQ